MVRVVSLYLWKCLWNNSIQHCRCNNRISNFSKIVSIKIKNDPSWNIDFRLKKKTKKKIKTTTIYQLLLLLLWVVCSSRVTVIKWNCHKLKCNEWHKTINEKKKKKTIYINTVFSVFRLLFFYCFCSFIHTHLFTRNSKSKLAGQLRYHKQNKQKKKETEQNDWKKEWNTRKSIYDYCIYCWLILIFLIPLLRFLLFYFLSYCFLFHLLLLLFCCL